MSPIPENSPAAVADSAGCSSSHFSTTAPTGVRQVRIGLPVTSAPQSKSMGKGSGMKPIVLEVVVLRSCRNT